MITFRKRDIGCWRIDSIVVDPIVKFDSLKDLFEFLRNNGRMNKDDGIMITDNGYVMEYNDSIKIVIGYIEELKTT